MVVVFQQCFQCFHSSTPSLVVLTGQTNVEEPQQIVNLLCLLSDAEKCQHRTLRTTTRTITTSVRRITLTTAGPSRATAGPGKPFSRSPITSSFRLKHPAIFHQLEDRGGDWSLKVASCMTDLLHTLLLLLQTSFCCCYQRWKWVSGSWVTASDPLNHDEITAQ